VEHQQRERLISAILRRYRLSAERVGLAPDDLRSIGRIAAIEAESSWRATGGRSLSSWIYLAIEYRFRDAINKAACEIALDLEDWIADDDAAIDVTLTVRQSLQSLRAYLPEPQWALLWLRYAEGWTCAELAQQRGVSSEAIWQQLCRARKKSVRFLEAAL
jgi:RNA polymerase sigma factor (sigma-70 family)